jgi:hypothetical protein
VQRCHLPRNATPSACPVTSGVAATTACSPVLPCSATYLLKVLPAAAAADTAAPLAPAPVLPVLAPKGTALRTTWRGLTVRRKAMTSEMVRPLPPNEVLLRDVMLAAAAFAVAAGRQRSTLRPSYEADKVQQCERRNSSS